MESVVIEFYGGSRRDKASRIATQKNTEIYSMKYYVAVSVRRNRQTMAFLTALFSGEPSYIIRHFVKSVTFNAMYVSSAMLSSITISARKNDAHHVMTLWH